MGQGSVEVSVITPSYGAEKFIADTINSVISQTYQNWEMIIVDDLSPDRSNQIIEGYCQKDDRVKLIKLEKNSGAAVARNKAIEKAKGRYIAFLDADDTWESEKLEKQIKFMQEKKCTISYSGYHIFNEKSKFIKTIIPPLKLAYQDLLKTNHIPCLTAVYDTWELGKVYMPLLRRCEDYGLWLTILKKISFAYGLNEPLASYRVVSGSVSSNKINLLKDNYYIFRKHEKFSVVRSFYYLVWNIIYKLLKIIKVYGL